MFMLLDVAARRLCAAWPWLFALALLLLVGCTPFPKVDVAEPTTARPAPVVSQAASNGAIFQAAAYRPLFEDRRARFIGDTLTVAINENLSASLEKKSAASRTGSVTANPANVILPIGGSLGANSITANGASSNTFDGKGSTNSTNAFTGTITVTVTEVLPNGNLAVSGEKQIGNNQQVETLRFSGVVNPNNIINGNTVSSAQVADARLELRGRGYTDEAQIMGWLARFFLSFLPF
jgi:flagellar L-ring protein precursor FlgH